MARALTTSSRSAADRGVRCEASVKAWPPGLTALAASPGGVRSAS
eukprot:CAMPEP_0182820792 /NCGR_PEP_ID=MMETSP0006_2-20121128/13317_1 /TAXON_ID=97485 /ORGANISM="Prymnesium parvum, Strain Texoma1" /LENGTH=44 /DNA_ID= /DNA_START= /DNA_END= /DNA_ORIENTATION=